jgi:hypothetical protein
MSKGTKWKAKRKEPVDPELYDIAKNMVKSRVKVWPSAYASGQLVSEYKRLFAQMYGNNKSPYLEDNEGLGYQLESELESESVPDPLNRWFREVWVNVCEKDNNNNYLPCGRKKANLSPDSYPYCRPLHRISKNTPRTVEEFSQEELDRMCTYKRSNPQGIKGKPTRIYHENVLEQQVGGSYDIVVRELTDDERNSSSKRTKKYAVDLIEDGKTVYFGHNEYEDFTLHKDPDRMSNYINRHQKREDWDMTGIATPGFWSRWLLWNKPSFVDSLKDIEKRFNVKIDNQTERTD